jgi:hypothetical protein
MHPKVCGTVVSRLVIQVVYYLTLPKRTPEHHLRNENVFQHVPILPGTRMFWPPH